MSQSSKIMSQSSKIKSRVRENAGADVDISIIVLWTTKFRSLVRCDEEVKGRLSSDIKDAVESNLQGVTLDELKLEYAPIRDFPEHLSHSGFNQVELKVSLSYRYSVAEVVNYIKRYCLQWFKDKDEENIKHGFLDESFLQKFPALWNRNYLARSLPVYKVDFETKARDELAPEFFELERKNFIDKQNEGRGLREPGRPKKIQKKRKSKRTSKVKRSNDFE